MYNGIYTKEQFAYNYDVIKKWLELKVYGDSLGDRLKIKGIDCVAIYGANDIGKMAYEDIKQDIIVKVFIDKKAREIPNIDGIDVIVPSDTKTLPNDCYVLVTPEYFFKDIAEVLLLNGIREDNIVSLAMVVG